MSDLALDDEKWWHEHMEEGHGDRWRNCIKEGKCWIIQDTIFNPYDGKGLDLICLVHNQKMNIPVERGQWALRHRRSAPRAQRTN